SRQSGRSVHRAGRLAQASCEPIMAVSGVSRMPTYEFPALGFNPAPGDPAAVDAAARSSQQFAQRLANDVATLNRMQASSWVGDAGDAFRDKIKDLPKDLDRSRAAHEATGAALSSYASALSSAQGQARMLEQEAAEALRQE